MAGATLKEVAARAGVSHQTVSNVLNGVSVRPATLERVRAAIRELDYHPNFAARALRAAKAMTVTLAFYEHSTEAITDPYRNLVQAAIAHEATRHGYSLLNTFVYRERPPTLASLRQQYRQRRTDGTILVGLRNDPALVRELEAAGAPLVLFDYSGPPVPFPTVTAQYAEGMHQVVDHVVGLGRHRIALVIAGDDITTRIEREESFLATTRAYGIETIVCRGDWTYSFGERAFRDLWASERRPDAVVSANDRMAIGCLAAARDLGVRVPEEVAVVGFDDFEFSRYTHPALTTVHVPFSEMAAQAMTLLLGAISGDASPVGRIRLPVTLVRRQSA
ncbi:MAG TPA: LacI family DNA-binding transcriptional regulator [Deinococcales bacterium]|nr:LacI family DNA-binding transcriptional regulator [Deinococcales bacterium]